MAVPEEGLPGPAADPCARLLRAVVVARQPIARAGLRGLLAARADVVVVGQGASTGDTAHLAADLRPDVVLAAWHAGDVEEVAALAETLGGAGTPLVLLGDLSAPVALGPLLRAGVRGFLLPDATADEIGAALHAVAQGLLVLDPLLGRSLSTVTVAPRPGGDLAADEPLTEREREVLALLALGLPNKTIAKRLRISEHTVKFHVGSILAKLGAGSRTEAVTRAARRGLLAL